MRFDLGRLMGGTLVAALVAVGVGGAARAADEGAVLLLRGEQLASGGDCRAARPVLREARETDPQLARAALLEGECAIREQDYHEAIAPLEEARRLDPTLDRATLYLGIAHYQLGSLDAAQRELDRAAELLPDDADVHLYRGLVLLDRARAEEAVAALEQARALDPAGNAGPATAYFAGRAWQVAKDREKAERELQRVIEDYPRTPWAEEARAALEGSRARDRRRSGWARFSAGMEYDDNVVLRGAGVVLPTDISDEAGSRGVWFGRSGVELFRGAKWATGVFTGYYGSAHVDSELRSFDTHYPTGAIWLDRLIGERTYVRIQPDFAYASVDYDDFLMEGGVTQSLNHAFESAGQGQLFFRFETRDYRYPISDPRENRDGFNYIGGYDHSFFPGDRTELRGHVGANFYDAEGGEYTHVAPAVGVGLRQDLPFELTFDMDFRYRHEFYQNVSAFAAPSFADQRSDDVFALSALLERPITQNVKFTVRYRYENQDSNVLSLFGNACCTRPFDYERNIVGGFITVDFGAS
jgi:tetratricopeptide (TPR) repeat protein